jgi:CheY-like chemotaxis protein
MLLKQTSFLIVDDNVHMRKLLRQVLNGLGCIHIWEAPSAADAYQLLSVTQIDMALVDYRLEGSSGADLARMIRRSSDSPNRFLPIIMVTSYSERSKISEAIDSGVDEFLAKPISTAELLKRIRAVADLRRPFVRTPHFFGPDRRRRDDPRYYGPRRRESDTVERSDEML